MWRQQGISRHDREDITDKLLVKLSSCITNTKCQTNYILMKFKKNSYTLIRFNTIWYTQKSSTTILTAKSLWRLFRNRISFSQGCVQSKLTYDFPRRMDEVDSEVHERVGEAFVEPEIVPPRHRHYVTEPLRRTTGARVTWCTTAKLLLAALYK